MKVYLGESVWRQVEAPHMALVCELALLAKARGVVLESSLEVGDALISRARSRVASRFLASDADVLLTIDGDIMFSPADALKLCEQALARDIVGACYMTRSYPPDTAIQLPWARTVTFTPTARLTETPYVSTGFCAVHRRVFEKLTETIPHCHTRDGENAFWPFYMPFVVEFEGQHIYLSEDWAMQERARSAGFKVWLDPSVRLGHFGTKLYTIEDAFVPARPRAVPTRMRRERSGITYKRIEAP